MPSGLAADSSSLIAYFSGESGKDVQLIRAHIATATLILPPATLTEILSAKRPGDTALIKVQSLPLLSITAGFWQRAGLLRAELLRKGCKARLGDALIAQSCIDHDLPLITRDADFRHYAKLGGLKLA